MGEGGWGPSKKFEELKAALDRFCQAPTAEYSPDQKALELIEVRRFGDLVKLEFSKRAAAFAQRAAFEPWYSTTAAEDRPRRHQ